MAKKRTFSAHDIDALIPKLEQAFKQIDECRKRAASLAGSLSGSSNVDGGMVRAQALFLSQAVEEDVHYIAQLGGVVKDLDRGLVDFPAEVDGEPAWLCWRRGESRVRFWHGLEEGFTERQFLLTEAQTTLH